MPRLTRKNIKVFAGSATNNGVFGSLQANNPTTTSDVEQLQSLSAWSDGWNAATETSEELPPLEEIQGVEYVTTYQQAYIMQEGIPEWASSVTYYKGSVVKEVTSTGFKIYNSLTDNNTGNLLSDTSNWKLVMDSDDLYAFDNTVVHNTGNETVAGVKTFTSPIYKKDTNMDIDVNPESQINNQIWFSDKNDNLYATLQANQNTNGSLSFSLTGKSRTSNSYSTLSLVQFTDGTSYAIAPTPNSNVTGSQIITADWILPDYSKATNKSAGTTYTPTKDVRVMIAGTIKNSGDNGSMEARVQIGGSDKFTFYGGYVYGYNEDPFFITFDVRAGVSYKLYQVSGTLTVKQFIEIPFGG